MHVVCPPKFCITIVVDFSWGDCNTQEELKSNVDGGLSLSSGQVNVSENADVIATRNRWAYSLERKLTLRMKGPTENDANTQGTFDGEERALMLARKRRCSETH